MYSDSRVPLQSVPFHHDQPPAYPTAAEKMGPEPSKWNPKYWSTKLKALAALGLAAVLVAIIVGAYYGVRNNAYPDYSKLDYSLTQSYSGTDFFDNFDYYTGYDPTSGFVHYVDNVTASSMNLTYATSTSAVLKVDTTETDASTGRKSVRITSKTTYESGLFIFDIAHSPYGCGTWPAVWLSDPSNWPFHGEIDVLESVNQASSNKSQTTLHTTDDCNMDRKRKETGTVIHTNCLNTTNDNAGCGVYGTENSYGAGFNANGGGIYAMEWRDAGIRVWFFARGSLPSDLEAVTSTTSSSNSTAPDPSSWGEAMADFPGTDCDISSHFKNQSIIANIDLCGSWAGSTSVYNDEDSCPSTCETYVAQNATAFDQAYWEFNSFLVYTATS